MAEQGEIIDKHQLYLGSLGSKEREANVAILDVPDEGEALDGAVTDNDRIGKVWAEMDASCVVRTLRRLGRRDDTDRHCRPILLTLSDNTLRSGLGWTLPRSLRNMVNRTKKIYVKKNVHPSVRREWQRLRNAETMEKDRPDNAGRVIPIDTRERELYGDNCVINRWKLHPFF